MVRMIPTAPLFLMTPPAPHATVLLCTSGKGACYVSSNRTIPDLYPVKSLYTEDKSQFVFTIYRVRLVPTWDLNLYLYYQARLLCELRNEPELSKVLMY